MTGHEKAALQRMIGAVDRKGGHSMFNSLLLKILDKEASSAKSKPAEIIASLNIREGDIIADIGSGGGYFTLAFAGKAGKTGKVYAVDVKPKYLDFIRRKAAQEGFDNVRYVLGTGGEMKLPEAGLDLVFARNVFHHLPEPGDYFRNLKKYLKPDGKVSIIDHKPKRGFSFVALFKHHTPGETVVQEMAKAGYRLVESFGFLQDQTFNLFGMK
jgi:ubiquinone/menaquinone biosynthesis C-methylase UbiE